MVTACLTGGKKEAGPELPHVFSCVSDKRVSLLHFLQHVREGIKLLQAAVISGALTRPAK